MRRIRRTIATFVIVVATALSLGTPVAAEERVSSSALFWHLCTRDSTSVIFYRTSGDHGCNDAPDTVGFAALTTQPGGYHLQVCATDNFWYGMWVDPADENGNSTGNLIYYSDEAYGPCYNRDIGYPVRKFQAVWEGYTEVEFSPWRLPA